MIELLTDRTNVYGLIMYLSAMSGSLALFVLVREIQEGGKDDELE